MKEMKPHPIIDLQLQVAMAGVVVLPSKLLRLKKSLAHLRQYIVS